MPFHQIQHALIRLEDVQSVIYHAYPPIEYEDPGPTGELHVLGVNAPSHESCGTRSNAMKIANVSYESYEALAQALIEYEKSQAVHKDIMARFLQMEQRLNELYYMPGSPTRLSKCGSRILTV